MAKTESENDPPVGGRWQRLRRELTNPDVLLAILLCFLGVVATVYYAAHPEVAAHQLQWVQTKAHAFLHNLLAGVCVVLFFSVAWLAVAYLRQRRANRALCVHCRNESSGRWNKIDSVRLGCISYGDFLKADSFSNPKGFGYELITSLFKSQSAQIPFEAQKPWRDWGNVIEGLERSEYEMIATPLLSTFTRSRRVRFSSPLFFSNIGLYVRKEAIPDHFAAEMSLEEMQEKFQEGSRIKLFLIQGEISQALAKKYAPAAEHKTFTTSEQRYDLFEELVNDHAGSAVFCESYFAARSKTKVVNVLKWHEILYPVCFAVRASDYQLANLINIRLLAEESSPLERLRDCLKAGEGNEKVLEEFSRHFVDAWRAPLELSTQPQNAKSASGG